MGAKKGIAKCEDVIRQRGTFAKKAVNCRNEVWSQSQRDRDQERKTRINIRDMEEI